MLGNEGYLTSQKGQTMSEHLFGCGYGRINKTLEKRVDAIAKKFGASFTWIVEPSGEHRYWFAGPNRGEPFDGDMARDVAEALRVAGIKMPSEKLAEYK